jgi:hypothetical protein
MRDNLLFLGTGCVTFFGVFLLSKTKGHFFSHGPMVILLDFHETYEAALGRLFHIVERALATRLLLNIIIRNSE